MQKLIFTNTPGCELDALVPEDKRNSLFVLVDSNTRRDVLPRLLEESEAAKSAHVIEIEPGEDHKSVETLVKVWTELEEGGATRRSMLVNLGGGLVTDLGGFAASTFKRGMQFINMPTTLLGAVDAAVGGKTGVNFRGLKNEIGVFREAEAVVISTCYFSTLSDEELASGYAEMIKHAFLKGGDAPSRVLDYGIEERDYERLLPLLQESVNVKRDIVAQDPQERGLRKALNLGHTAGHAFEAFAMKRGRHLPHGHAVAAGLVVALVLSHTKEGMPTADLYRLADYVRSRYIMPRIGCNDYDELIGIMGHDKKNAVEGEVLFTLLKNPGELRLDCRVEAEEIAAAFDLTRDLLKI